jgi:hypothetical protein
MDITEAVGSQSVIARRPRSARITGFGRSGHSFFSERTTDPGSAADTQRDVHLTDLALNLRPVVETPWRWITNDLPFWYVV